MDSLIQTLADFIRLHHTWAGVVLGLIVLVESLVIIGAFVPATPILILAGSLIAAKVLDPVSVVLGCVAGAVIGDAISYALGRRLGSRALRHPWLDSHRRSIARTRLICSRYGAASIYIGRFFGPLRALVPVFLGMMGMGQKSFQIANVGSAVIWVLAALAPGYFAAKGLAKLEVLAEGHSVTLIVIAILVVVAVGGALWHAIQLRTARRAVGGVVTRTRRRS